MYGQGKYGLLAMGDDDADECFVCQPKEGYIDWVWYVAAAGNLILEEAGGWRYHGGCAWTSDWLFRIGVGRRAKLPDHVKGILGSCGGVFHEALVDDHAKMEQI